MSTFVAPIFCSTPLSPVPLRLPALPKYFLSFFEKIFLPAGVKVAECAAGRGFTAIIESAFFFRVLKFMLPVPQIGFGCFTCAAKGTPLFAVGFRYRIAAQVNVYFILLIFNQFGNAAS